jgi:hypothetical protein
MTTQQVRPRRDYCITANFAAELVEAIEDDAFFHTNDATAIF